MQFIFLLTKFYLNEFADLLKLKYNINIFQGDIEVVDFGRCQR